MQVILRRDLVTITGQPHECPWRLSKFCKKEPLFVGVDPCYHREMELLASSHGIGSSRIHGPGEGQSLTGTACSELPSWGERTYHCLFSEMRYEARDTASAPRMN
jgi:hypothetical protein